MLISLTDAAGLYASADGNIDIESSNALITENVFSEGSTDLQLTSGDLSVGVIRTLVVNHRSRFGRCDRRFQR